MRIRPVLILEVSSRNPSSFHLLAAVLTVIQTESIFVRLSSEKLALRLHFSPRSGQLYSSFGTPPDLSRCGVEKPKATKTVTIPL